MTERCFLSISEYLCSAYISLFSPIYVSCINLYTMANADISSGSRKKPTGLSCEFHFIKNKKSRQRMKTLRLGTTEQLVWKTELNVWAGSCPRIPRRCSFSWLRIFPVSSWTPGLSWQPKAARSNFLPGLEILWRKQFSPKGPEISCFESTKHDS